MVMHLDLQAHGLHGVAHGRAHAVQRIDGGHRKVAPFDARAVAGVVAAHVLVVRPGTFGRVDLEAGTVHLRLPLH